MLGSVSPVWAESSAGFALVFDGTDDLTTLLSTHITAEHWAKEGDEADRDTPAARAALAEAIVSQAEKLLTTEGYFAPTLTPRWQTDTPLPTLTVRVAEGTQTTLKHINWTTVGPLQHTEEAAEREAALRRASGLNIGDPFRQADWARAKRQALQSVLADGFPAARWQHTQARIDPTTHTADLSLTLDSGPAFTFGEIEVSGSTRYPAALITRFAAFALGTPYRQSLLLDYQATLQATPYFNSVMVDMPTDPSHADHAPVRVTVSDAPRQKVGFGLGYSTDGGMRGSVDYQHNNVWGQGVVFHNQLKLETRQQFLDGRFFLPRDGDGYLSALGVKAERSDIQNLLTQQETLYFSRTRTLGLIERGYNLTFIGAQDTPHGAVGTKTRALTASYTWTRRDFDSLLHPQRGTLLAVEAGGASRALLSDTDFVRGRVRGAWLMPLSNKGLLIARGELGQVWAARRQDVPMDWLFRSGGGGSVRGYAYQSLGLKTGNAIVGGRVLATASAEYQHPIKPDWRMAVFVDAGDAADSWRDFALNYGYGVGARWRSPIGPVGVDLAYGASTHKMQLHLALGATF